MARRRNLLLAAAAAAVVAGCGSGPAGSQTTGAPPTPTRPPGTAQNPVPGGAAPAGQPFELRDEFDGDRLDSRWSVSTGAGFRGTIDPKDPDPANRSQGVEVNDGDAVLRGQAQIGTTLGPVGKGQVLELVIPFTETGDNPSVRSIDLTDTGGAVVNGFPLINTFMNRDSVTVTLQTGPDNSVTLLSRPPLVPGEQGRLDLRLTNYGLQGCFRTPIQDSPFTDPTPFRGPFRLEPTSQLAQYGRSPQPGIQSTLALASVSARLSEASPQAPSGLQVPGPC